MVRIGAHLWLSIVTVACSLLAIATPSYAVILEVTPTHEALIRAIQTAKPGDILRLAPGTYEGNIIIEKPLTIDGQGQAILIGNEDSSTILVNAPDVTIMGLEIKGSGSDHQDIDSGVRLLDGANRAIVKNNRILGNLVGVDIHGPDNVLVTKNIIEGRRDQRMNDRGNGIYVWNARNTKIVENDVRWGRDGIFVTTSNQNEFIGNRFRDLRFAIHYMYAHKSVISGNISEGNHLGYAVMNSNDVTIRGNLSRDDRDYGIMLNYTNKSRINDNIIERSGGKCVFIYNAHKNVVSGNRFQSCDIGIHFTAGSEQNKISSNSFLYNRIQVKYAGTRWVDWSEDGVGNYWSDHKGFDLNKDGITDAIYRPNDVMDRILWTQPAAASLMGSPAIQLIKWSQSAFPALLPGGVVDKAPLMFPGDPEIPVWKDIQ